MLFDVYTPCCTIFVKSILCNAKLNIFLTIFPIDIQTIFATRSITFYSYCYGIFTIIISIGMFSFRPCNTSIWSEIAILSLSAMHIIKHFLIMSKNHKSSQNANGKNFSMTFSSISTGMAFPACFLVCVSDTTILKSSGNPCKRNISLGVSLLSPFTRR